MPVFSGKIQLCLFSLFNWMVSFVQLLFEPPLRLSVEETGIVSVQTHLSVEESAAENMQVTAQDFEASSLSGNYDDVAPFCHFERSTIPFSVPAKDEEELVVEDEVPRGDALLLFTVVKSSPNIFKSVDHDQQPLHASISQQEEKKKKRCHRERKPLEKGDPVCSGICYCPVRMVMHMTKRARNLLLKAGVGRRKSLNMLWILLLLQTFFTVISGHLSCEHTVNITETNLLTIQTSDLKQHCNLKSVPLCPDLTECFKDKLKLCSISNSTKKMCYSMDGVGKYFIECGTDNTKEVDLTEKDCKKINTSSENATPMPYPESSSTSPNVRLILLTIVLVAAALVVLAVGLIACYKNKKRLRTFNLGKCISLDDMACKTQLYDTNIITH
ncbi:uncharacterized protein LOC144770660 isoform X3 [Lissotriton helveticus]